MILGPITRMGVLASACAVALVPTGASAQFWEKLTNRKETIYVTHPPEVVFKEGSRIAVAEFHGQCGAEITDKITDIVGRSRKFELLDRANLSTVLREHDFQQSDNVSPATAATLGQMLGAGGLVTGRVTRCLVRTSAVMREGDPVRTRDGIYQTYIIKTTATISGSMQILDVSTGKTIVREPIDVTHEVPRRAVNDPYIAPADPEQVRSEAYGQVANRFQQMLLGWVEPVTVLIYDDKKWSLNVSADQMKRGDFLGAIETLKASIERNGQDPKSDAKILSKAQYNLGLALLYSNHLEDAMESLQKSNGTRGTDIAREAMVECRKMMAVREERRRKEAAAIDLGAKLPPPTEPGHSAPPERGLLTNADIMSMAAARMSDTVILSKIKTSSCNFDTSTAALIKLKTAGVSDAILSSILDRSK